MKVKVVGLDQISMLPVVVLTDLEERGFIPLVIGPAEANAIGMELDEVKLSRPLTHDLIVSMLKTLGAVIERVVITHLEDETYFASIVIKMGDKEYEIDARPSDSIAIALRSKVPIYVSEQVAAQAMVAKPIDDQEMEDFRKFLDKLTPEDFRRHNRPD